MDKNKSTIIQASCFETNVSRRSDNSESSGSLLALTSITLPGLQNGVKAMIVIAFVVGAMGVVYAILYQVT